MIENICIIMQVAYKTYMLLDYVITSKTVEHHRNLRSR